MTTKVVENVCATIGEVVRSIRTEIEEGSCFIRVRIKLDISLPLCRGRVITLVSVGKSWVFLSISVCQISVFGVVGCVMVIRIALCGSKVREILRKPTDNLTLI